MSCFGSLVGAMIGSFLGGPLGAIAGAAFGSMAGNGQSRFDQMHDQRLNTNQRAEMVFFVGAFSMLGKLAISDGRVSEEERRAIDRFMTHTLRLDAASRQSAWRIFDAATYGGQDFAEFGRQIYRQFNHQPQLLLILVDILTAVAAADATGITSQEKQLLDQAAAIFRIGDSQYRQILAKHQTTASSYEILGCRSSDTEATIKSAYRKLVNEYHPDKIIAKGLPAEFQKFAEKKFREIQSAYEAIRQEKGF